MSFLTPGSVVTAAEVVQLLDTAHEGYVRWKVAAGAFVQAHGEVYVYQVDRMHAQACSCSSRHARVCKTVCVRDCVPELAEVVQLLDTAYNRLASQ
jgi:hypothetical protein